MQLLRPLSPAILLGAGAVLVSLVLATAWLDAATPRAHAAATDLLFSEYVEGTSTNKALELYNGTTSPIALDGLYNVQIFANGRSNASATIALVGVVQAGETFVLARAGADPDLVARADQTTSNFLFIGNDAVALRRAGAILDVVGQIGTDPGTSWRSGDVQTADQSLRRKAGITMGDANGADAFDPAEQWVSFPVDAFTGLGEHESTHSANEAPQALLDIASAAGESIRIDALANDLDPDGDALTLTGVSAPEVGSAIVIEDGRAIEYTPPSVPRIRDTFEYEVSDPEGATSTATIEVEFRHPSEPQSACASRATIIGTQGDDVIFGTPQDDVILSMGGNDLVVGRGGDDILCGGSGRDTMFGGSGDDILIDIAGRTLAFGGRGDDRITTGPGADIVWAGAGDDWISTGPGRDHVHAGRGDDVIAAGSGPDIIDGGPGADRCQLELSDTSHRCP